ncbi:1-deoxy-D-xylulose-5-phosphate synthase [Leptospira sp. GIMC2001]|uniref:1-deoxy-D-xylulose-5-phosphate synthase n=1 Tax=Leptospira sp. GIMC2001 TaxID=1513297 RepID=UPI0023493A8F|nr:1-deoxy-D-xylulose-5-phosphate synthase [Leptospira sp. GIMC2001]WCL48725.1 1-deoxy-D-xylulose-5-phosphate synthase [Leptospira sp. GIMC2001]
MTLYPYLDRIRFPSDLRNLQPEDLPSVCRDLREFIIDTLAGIGGHFASNLGVVELTVALHYVFKTPDDKLIWDVGHQTYPHKILTGRRDELKTVRKFGGLSGFPKREESPYDLYNTGHAGTSISQVLGEACARDLLGLSHKIVGVIGDASIATGMALEAMNHGGHIRPNSIIVLNDNYMSISKNVGSISSYLNALISSQIYNSWKKFTYTFMQWLPIIGPAILSFMRKAEKSFKHFMTPGGLFEDLGFSYFGPVNGHDVLGLVKILNKVQNIEGPVVLHVITQKGKGYDPAEKDPIKYHGVTPFNKLDGAMAPADSNKISYSKIVGNTLIDLTKVNPKIAVITPAMIEGSGLKEYSEMFPNHTFDVGIAEQHSIAFAGAMSSGGAIPYVCIYSTFLTRGMDQLVEDVSLMNLPVRFVIDRAGVVGPDGETHQGLSDIGYLLGLPNMDLVVPSSGQDIIDSLHFMNTYDSSPIAIRFPKDSVKLADLNFAEPRPLTPGKFRILSQGSDLAILSIGSMLDISQKTRKLLEEKDKSVKLIDLFWLRPLDWEALESELGSVNKFIIMDESYRDMGASGYILNQLNPNTLNKFLKTIALPPEPILHGDRIEILDHYNISPEKIYSSILPLL